ncbi:hypothetical protein V7O62_12860 [Methanolobus sp. ZRKC2]|uniref:hypothetical protein n=1 Tax=Methanolobus sp. ZRKC2 TaxID=3125783 RepID=UPI00324562EF
MVDTVDMLVFWAVILARFFIPLAIPKYPLPAIVASLVLDGVDQTIFQQFTSLPLEGYQGYDKALDIYYLAITYLSTLRNWTNQYAFKWSRFLFYYRLLGVALFELTQLRLLLLIFPNVFEYFFIFYEVVRLKWKPTILTKKQIIASVAFIWIFIKLPQEYWIHIAQIDTTDMIKANPWTILILVGWSAVVIIGVWLILKGMPKPQKGFSIAADPIPSNIVNYGIYYSKDTRRPIFNRELFEKVLLVSLLSIIFAQVLPGVQATNAQIAIAVTFVIIVNTALSHWFARRGTHWESIIREFAIMSVVNSGIIIVYDLFIAPRYESSISVGVTLFFILLLTLNVVLYDRYRPIYVRRFGKEAQETD